MHSKHIDPWHGRILWLFSAFGLASILLASFAYGEAIHAASPLRAALCWPAILIGTAGAIRYGTVAGAGWLSVIAQRRTRRRFTTQ